MGILNLMGGRGWNNQYDHNQTQRIKAAKRAAKRKLRKARRKHK